MANAEPVSVIRQQQKLLEELLAVLEQEREVLCRPHPEGEALEAFAKSKSGRLKALELLEKHSGASKADAISEEESKALLQMQDVARKVHQANGVNGKLLHSRMLWNLRILNFIREAQDYSGYSANGRSDSRTSTLSSQA